MLDHSFTLQAILDLKGSVSSLETKIDRLISDVKGQGDRIDEVRHQVSFVKGALWVIAGMVVLGGGVLTAIVSGKISISFH